MFHVVKVSVMEKVSRNYLRNPFGKSLRAWSRVIRVQIRELIGKVRKAVCHFLVTALKYPPMVSFLWKR